MVVIMKYDMADNLRYNRDRRRRNQKRRTTRKALSQKKSIQTTMTPAAETSVTSYTACKGIRREVQLHSSCIILAPPNLGGKKLLATLKNARMDTL
jgi:hypothetical protein